MIVGAGLFLFGKRRKPEASLPLVLGISSIIVLIAYGIISACATSSHLPETMFPDAIVTRPWDIIALCLYMLGGIFIFPRFYKRNPSLFSHSLLVCVIPNIAAQLNMAFGSAALFDHHFNVAHFLKIIAYLAPFLALSLDYRTSRQERIAVNEFQNAQAQLRESHEKLEVRVKERTRELEDEITQRERVENELILCRERLNDAQALAHVGNWDVDVKTGELYWSDEIYRMFGLEIGSKINVSTAISLFHPEDREKLRTHVGRAISEKKRCEYENRFVRSDGEIRWSHNIGMIKLDNEGEVSHFYGVFQDITERKEAEEKERAAQELFAVISEAQNQFIADADPYDMFSQLLDNVLMLTQSEYGFIGERLYTESGEPYIRDFAIRFLVGGENIQSFVGKYAPPNLEFCNLDNLFGEVIKTGKPVISNDPARDPRRGKIGPPPGRLRLDSFLGLPLYHGLEFVGMIGIANRPGGYDEELAKFLEPFLITSANIIEAHKIDRQRKEAEEKFQAALSQLVNLEKLAAIGQLSAGVCHEILNPLNIISIRLQRLLAKSSEKMELQTTFEKMKDETNRIKKIVSGLMTFARKKDTEAKRVQISQELESALSLWGKDFEVDNITIVKKFETGLPELYVDIDEMRQVFLNIMNNAKYAMKDGGILTVSAKGWAKNDSAFVRLIISDTGTGIKKDHLDKIFDPFFTTKPEGVGTGMGLSIVHSIMEKHGGTVRVESKEGRGTALIMDFPVK